MPDVNGYNSWSVDGGVYGTGSPDYNPSDYTLNLPMSTPSIASGSGSNYWGNWFGKVTDTGLSVFKDIYGGVQPGTFVKTPQGGIIERLPSNSPSATLTSFPSIGTGMNIGDIILWGGLGLLGLFVASRIGGK